MKSLFALLGRIFCVIALGSGGILFTAWLIAAIIVLVFFLALALVCMIPLSIGVLLSNWADRLEGKNTTFPNSNLMSKFTELLERDK
jgi:hypothetical protein